MRFHQPLAIVVAFAIAGCGTDVDVGGGSDDAGPNAADAGTGQQCEPCTTITECQSGDTCGQFAGHTFCARLCPQHNECAVDESCTTVTTTAGARLDVCTPKSGACAAAPPPMSDGGALTHCGSLNGPSVASACTSCSKASSDCQPNGCYGGWWCNTTKRDCQRPPTSCP